MRILHFEYSEFFRRIVHDMAVRQGFDYVGTSYGGDLFKHLSKQDFDVVFTGMELSDMRVEVLLNELSSSKYSYLPIVILTSSNVEDIKTRLKHLKFNDLILKEMLTIEVLTNCINRIELMK